MNKGTSCFSDDVDCHWLDSGGDHRSALLDKTMIYTDSKGRRWVAPAGMVSDGASIPRVLWSIIGGPYEGSYRRGAWLHDYAYQCGGSMVLPDGSVLCYTRSDADWMLCDAIRADGGSILLADSIYAALELFGCFAWWEDCRTRTGTGTKRMTTLRAAAVVLSLLLVVGVAGVCETGSKTPRRGGAMTSTTGVHR